MKPAVKRQMAGYMMQHYGVSERRACRVVKQHRHTYRYQSVLNPHIEPRTRMREIAATRVRYGYRRIHILLQREGRRESKHLVYRLYREEGLAMRVRPARRRKMAVQRRERFKPTQANQVWSLDFVADQMANGLKFRTLTVVDVYIREALAITVGQRLKGEDVIATLDSIRRHRGAPKLLFCDNGSEYSGRLLDLWAYHHQVRTDFSRPGKPTDNAYVESFNGTFRDECLNVHWLESLADARMTIEAWRQDYNESRPHMALGNVAPAPSKQINPGKLAQLWDQETGADHPGAVLQL